MESHLGIFRESVSHAVQAVTRRAGDRRFKSPKTVDVGLSQWQSFSPVLQRKRREQVTLLALELTTWLDC
jgi:hypothetical protein